MTDKIEIADLRRVELRPGDKVVLKVGFPLSAETVQRIQEYWEKFAPGTPLFLLDSSMSLDILSEAA